MMQPRRHRCRRSAPLPDSLVADDVTFIRRSQHGPMRPRLSRKCSTGDVVAPKMRLYVLPCRISDLLPLAGTTGWAMEEGSAGSFES